MDGKMEMDNGDAGTRDNIRYYGSLGKDGLSERIRALDVEWDSERFVTVALSGAGLLGIVMGMFGSRLWRVLTWASLPLLFLHGREKRRPWDSLVKSLGLRSRKAIQGEMYALKALRGDFRNVETDTEAVEEKLERSATRALEAVKA